MIIGHVALIQSSKKQDFVLRVIKRLKDNGNDVIGVFAGECRDQEFMDRLEKMTEYFGLRNDVLFLGRRTDIPDLLKAIDVLMIPSAFEGFPLAGLEAAAAGVPVAACDVAGAEEFIRVSGNGEVFAENNVSEAASMVLSIIENKEHYQKAGRCFAEKMDIKQYKKNIVNAFAQT